MKGVDSSDNHARFHSRFTVSFHKAFPQSFHARMLQMSFHLVEPDCVTFATKLSAEFLDDRCTNRRRNQSELIAHN